MLLGRPASDFDVATDARPETVAKLFRRAGAGVVPTGIKHGTVTILWRIGAPHPLSVECTTFRGESGYTDGRHPDEVSFLSDINGDLLRRDFTMNALAVRLPGGNLRKDLLDITGGAADIKRRLIRAVGSAEERFREDGLRPLRALRFAAQLGFDVDAEILAAIPKCLDVTAKVSAERVRDEFTKILLSEKPSRAFVPAHETGLL
jgi:tRNA nucleotidyltransferase/poly(A) polymerase